VRRIAIAALALAAAPLAAQQPAGDACAPVRISREKLVDFATAWGAADPRAKAWRPDAVLTRASHTLFGPVDAEGRSKRWDLEYRSLEKDEGATFTVSDGVLTCAWSSSRAAVTPPALRPDFERDVKKLLRIAAEHGGREYEAEGYAPRIELRIGSRRWLFRFMLGDPIRYYWYVDYLHPSKKKVFRVTIDANDGSFVDSQSYRRS
jgi:hypothetical protein